jgi:hypothetical protein
MPFVRLFSSEVRQQYSEIFGDEAVIQIDPRFLRYATNYDVAPGKCGYRHGPDTAYADVGIIDLARLRKLGRRMKGGGTAQSRGTRRSWPDANSSFHAGS